MVLGSNKGLLYALDKDDLTRNAFFDTSQKNTSTDKYVCSSPAISYAAQSGYKWIYVVSRADYRRQDGKGTLFAFRQNKN